MTPSDPAAEGVAVRHGDVIFPKEMDRPSISVENHRRDACADRLRPFSESASARTIAASLTAMAMLLAAADWLPENPYVDPDLLEFALTVASGRRRPSRSRCAIAWTPPRPARWRNRALLSFVTLAALDRRRRTDDALDLSATSRRAPITAAISPAAGFAPARCDATAAGFREREFDDAKARRNLSHRRGRRFVHLRQWRAAAGSLFGSAAGAPAGALRGAEFRRPRARTRRNIATLIDAPAAAHSTRTSCCSSGMSTTWRTTTRSGRPTFDPLMPIRGLHNWLSDASALYTVANMQWAEAQVAFGMTTSYPDYLHRRLGDPEQSRFARSIAICCST